MQSRSAGACLSWEAKGSRFSVAKIARLGGLASRAVIVLRVQSKKAAASCRTPRRDLAQLGACDYLPAVCVGVARVDNVDFGFSGVTFSLPGSFILVQGYLRRSL
jgi:hypothetical protein